MYTSRSEVATLGPEPHRKIGLEKLCRMNQKSALESGPKGSSLHVCKNPSEKAALGPEPSKPVVNEKLSLRKSVCNESTRIESPVSYLDVSY